MESLRAPDEASLPETVLFVAGEVATDDDRSGERSIESLMEETRDSWSLPLLFYPDGTTSQAVVYVRNERQLYKRITLRALTGVGRVSEILSEDQARRLQSH